jgi:hypothetical protein
MRCCSLGLHVGPAASVAASHLHSAFERNVNFQLVLWYPLWILFKGLFKTNLSIFANEVWGYEWTTSH